MKKVKIYADGACSPNPGVGGYGAMLVYQDKSKDMSKGFKNTTNNRMELLGIIEPLESLKEVCEVHIVTDSQYVANAINQNWIKSWIKKGWKTAAKKPVKNQDLWNRFIHMINKHTITIEWVRGHVDHPENTHCDGMAVAARMGSNLVEDEGYDEK